MAYTNFQHCTASEYQTIIYSGDAKNKLKVLFNGVEYSDIDNQCEKLTVKSRVIANGENRFSLDNFISKEAELILRDFTLSDIVSPLTISIGTLVDEENNTYEYVPIGIFNIENSPTTDGGKTTITLRDNSVKFDFNYNAYNVIQEHGGTATKLQILQDICTKAGITCNITTFLGSTDLIGIYDNTITARTYISYLAEQAGSIATINRDGELIFVSLSSLTTHTIPLSIVEKYEVGTIYNISRVVYEDAIRKYETGSETNDTLYLNSANPYISSQSQIEAIAPLVTGFSIYSLTTGKIIGNPAIDPYDLISITDGSNTYITLATNELTYSGINMNTFETTIGEAEKEENVTVNSEESFRKFAKTNIDNVKATVEIAVGNTEEISSNLRENYYTSTQVNTLVAEATTGITNNYTETGGNNLLRNTAPYFMTSDNVAEYWEGNVERISDSSSLNGYGFSLLNGTTHQAVTLKNGTYSLSFSWKQLIELATTTIQYNGRTIVITNSGITINGTEIVFVDDKYDANGIYIEWNNKYFSTTGDITSGNMDFIMTCDTDNGMEIYELLLNYGKDSVVWTQNANESTSDTVNISKGITVSSNTTNTIATMDSDGFRVKNKSNSTVVMEATDKGATIKEITSDKGTIAGLLIQKVGDEVWITGV